MKNMNQDIKSTISKEEEEALLNSPSLGTADPHLEDVVMMEPEGTPIEESNKSVDSEALAKSLLGLDAKMTIPFGMEVFGEGIEELKSLQNETPESLFGIKVAESGTASLQLQLIMFSQMNKMMKKVEELSEHVLELTGQVHRQESQHRSQLAAEKAAREAEQQEHDRRLKKNIEAQAKTFQDSIELALIESMTKKRIPTTGSGPQIPDYNRPSPSEPSSSKASRPKIILLKRTPVKAAMPKKDAPELKKMKDMQLETPPSSKAPTPIMKKKARIMVPSVPKLFSDSRKRKQEDEDEKLKAEFAQFKAFQTTAKGNRMTKEDGIVEKTMEEEDGSAGPPARRQWCQICHQGHQTKKCPKFTTKKEKHEAFMAVDRCLNCGFLSHKTEDCQFEVARCGECGGPHITYAHPQESEDEEEDQEESEEEEEIEEGECSGSDEED